MDPFMSWPVVARFSTVGEAQSARSALEAAEIPVLIADEEMIALNWMYSNALGGVKLLVSAENLESSEEILKTAAEDDPGEPSQSAKESVPASRLPQTCPSCQSVNVARIPRLTLFVFAALVIYAGGVAVHQPELAMAGVAAAALLAAVAPTHRCTACGERWTSSDNAAGSVGDAPLPTASDTLDERCPRCGSVEVHRLYYRRLKVIPLFVSLTMIVVLPICLFLPKWRCDSCGKTL
jgi:phage FluMu protein Com